MRRAPLPWCLQGLLAVVQEGQGAAGLCAWAGSGCVQFSHPATSTRPLSGAQSTLALCCSPPEKLGAILA